jgi:hypothetical protein
MAGTVIAGTNMQPFVNGDLNFTQRRTGVTVRHIFSEQRMEELLYDR